MEAYQILSTPISPLAPKHYKGLYRSEPFPPDGSCSAFIALWEQYLQYQESGLWNTDPIQIPLNELQKLAALASSATGEPFEIVYTNKENSCPHDAVYYGIDVVGAGGYSLLGDGLFRKGGAPLLSKIRDTFGRLLNGHALFGTEQEALRFMRTLEEIRATSPGLVEDEEWRYIHVFGLRPAKR